MLCSMTCDLQPSGGLSPGISSICSRTAPFLRPAKSLLIRSTAGLQSRKPSQLLCSADYTRSSSSLINDMGHLLSETTSSPPFVTQILVFSYTRPSRFAWAHLMEGTPCVTKGGARGLKEEERDGRRALGTADCIPGVPLVDCRIGWSGWG
jgi:hypothetical protein